MVNYTDLSAAGVAIEVRVKALEDNPQAGGGSGPANEIPAVPAYDDLAMLSGNIAIVEQVSDATNAQDTAPEFTPGAAVYMRNTPGALDFTELAGELTPGLPVPVAVLNLRDDADQPFVLSGIDWDAAQALGLDGLGLMNISIQAISGGALRILALSSVAGPQISPVAIYSYDDAPDAEILIDGVQRPGLFIGWQTLAGELLDTPAGPFCIPDVTAPLFAALATSADPPKKQMESGLYGKISDTWELVGPVPQPTSPVPVYGALFGDNYSIPAPTGPSAQYKIPLIAQGPISGIEISPNGDLLISEDGVYMISFSLSVYPYQSGGPTSNHSANIYLCKTAFFSTCLPGGSTGAFLTSNQRVSMAATTMAELAAGDVITAWLSTGFQGDNISGDASMVVTKVG